MRRARAALPRAAGPGARDAPAGVRPAASRGPRDDPRVAGRALHRRAAGVRGRAGRGVARREPRLRPRRLEPLPRRRSAGSRDRPPDRGDLHHVAKARPQGRRRALRRGARLLRVAGVLCLGRRGGPHRPPRDRPLRRAGQRRAGAARRHRAPRRRERRAARLRAARRAAPRAGGRRGVPHALRAPQPGHAAVAATWASAWRRARRSPAWARPPRTATGRRTCTCS